MDRRSGPQILEHAAPRSEERGACLAAEINFTYTRLTGAFMPPVPHSYDDAGIMSISGQSAVIRWGWVGM